MSKDSPISAGKTMSFRLIDESDSGYYVVAPDEKKAMFIPRSAVSLVYYSDEISDSKILSGHPTEKSEKSTTALPSATAKP